MKESACGERERETRREKKRGKKEKRVMNEKDKGAWWGGSVRRKGNTEEATWRMQHTPLTFIGQKAEKRQKRAHQVRLILNAAATHHKNEKKKLREEESIGGREEGEK